jgi:hypothetical protein
MDPKSLAIGALVVAAAVLGYLYYDSQQTKVDVDIGTGRIDIPANRG